MDLLVTVAAAKLIEGLKSGSKYDIRTLLRKVPGARIVSGNPEIAVRVAVDVSQVDEVRAAVGHICVVDRCPNIEVY